MAFEDQQSLIKLKKYSIMPDAKAIELVFKPICGFQGDKVLQGWKNIFKRRSIILSLDQPDSVKEIRSDKLYPILGKGLQGSVEGNVVITDIGSYNPYYKKLQIAIKRIEELETTVKSLMKTVEFLSSPAEKQVQKMISILKETKKLSEPASMEYFQYTYPRTEVIEGEE